MLLHCHDPSKFSLPCGHSTPASTNHCHISTLTQFSANIASCPSECAFTNAFGITTPVPSAHSPCANKYLSQFPNGELHCTTVSGIYCALHLPFIHQHLGAHLALFLNCYHVVLPLIVPILHHISSIVIPLHCLLANSHLPPMIVIPYLGLAALDAEVAIHHNSSSHGISAENPCMTSLSTQAVELASVSAQSHGTTPVMITHGSPQGTAIPPL